MKADEWGKKQPKKHFRGLKLSMVLTMAIMALKETKGCGVSPG